MKLPWNKKYLVICFHVVVTFIIMYSFRYFIDLFAYIMANFNHIIIILKNGLGFLISVFSVVVIAFVISYLFDPVVDFLQDKYNKFILPKIDNIKISKKIHKSKKIERNIQKPVLETRIAGTVLLYIIILSTFVIVGGLGVNKISNIGGSNLIDSVTIIINNTVKDFSSLYDNLEDLLVKWGLYDLSSENIDKIIKSVTGFVSNLGTVFIDFLSSFFTGLVNVLISFVIAFYFLKDKAIIKDKFQSLSYTFLPKKSHNFINNCLGDIHAVFSGYIRGQLLDASIMALLISLGLSIAGVKFAIIIGIIAGFSNVIPYFGALMGFVLAISVSILNGEPMKAVYSVIIMLVLQQVDTIFIVPKVVGESVELSPVLVIIALSVAGQLFGIWGMVFAVPVFATIKLFASRIYQRQKIKKDLLETLEPN